jgi:uncharacterized protein (TIGR02996 family)
VNAELVARIVADPSDLAAWQVYSDWLLERDDPRGELIALELAVEAGRAAPDAPARIGALARDEERLLSPRLFAQAHYWRFELWRGFVRGAALTFAPDDRPGVEAIDALFADPHAGLLATLECYPVDEVLLDALVAEPRRSLRVLRVPANLPPGFEAHVPQLEELELLAHRGVWRLAHPNLRVLRANRTSCPAAVNAAWDLPRLDTLVWEMRGSNDPMFGVGSILHAPPPTLQRLELELPDGAVAALARMPCLAQIRTLVLEIGLQSIRELLNRAHVFAHLDELTVRYAGYDELSADEVVQLRERAAAAFPRTRLDVRWDELMARAVMPSADL